MRKSVAYNICMKTGFFRKKAFILAGILSIATVISGFFYAHALIGAVKVNVGESFYFLISEEENVAASAEEVYLDGGAGYVMSRGRTNYAVYSCYFTETDAKTVRNNLNDKDIPASVIEESVSVLYLKKRSEKQNAEKLSGCFSTLSSCIHLLYDMANKAEAGEYTQQTLRRTLSSVGGVLSCLAEENSGGIFTDISACAAQASLMSEEIIRGTIYAKDIRYLQVYLCDSYLLLASEFSI